MNLPDSLRFHRVESVDVDRVCAGNVHVSPIKLVWFLGMLAGATIGGIATFSVAAFGLFVVTTALVLLLGHSLGSHRKLIHDSYECPRWLEYFLVYCGVQVGLDGPIGLMRQHELRDYAQRLPVCHDYLRHGEPFWKDAWWQLACTLHLDNPPQIGIEDRVAKNRFYVFLERTWMAQQLPWAFLFYAWGGWGFVFWGVCARVVAGVGGHWLIGYFAHNHGEMNYEVRGAAVQGHNVAWTSLLTMGECWHNNHHAYPGSSKLGLYPGEWDPGWWTLQLLRRCKLAWNFKLPENLPERPELVAIDRGDASLGLAATLKLAFAAEPLAMHWPAATLSPRTMRRLLGGAVALEHDPRARRLTVHSANGYVRGLPGIFLALARKCSTARLLSWITIPAAVLVERVSTSLHALPA